MGWRGVHWTNEPDRLRRRSELRIETRMRAKATIVVSAVLFACVVPVAHGDELKDLRDAVARQGALIEGLQGEVADLREREANSAATGRATDEEEVPTGISSEYVDERIEDFETAPESRFMISGYGTAEFIGTEDAPDGFGVSFNPGFHYRMSSRLHFNGELELELGRQPGFETETEVGLEFSQIDFLLNDWMVVSGGYFLTPFNAFGQRLHPNWINKMASRPILYGGQGIIPVIKQVGLMVSGGAPLCCDRSKFTYAAYAVNSPNLQGDPTDRNEALDIDFTSTSNLTSDFAGGGRLGFLPIPNIEIGGSFQAGKLAGSNKRFMLVGSDFWYRWRELEIRAEYVRLSREDSNPASNGYYIQAAYRLWEIFPSSESAWSLLGRVETVVRWGQIASFDPKEREQLAVGLVFWVYESAPLKFTYERNSGGVKDDRFIAQFAYGF